MGLCEEGKPSGERSLKRWVRRRDIRDWFGDDLLTKSVDLSETEDSDTAFARQMERLVDWPHPFAPIETEGRLISVVDKSEVTEEIARIYLREVS